MTKIHPWALGIIIVIVVFFIATISVVLFVSKDPPNMVTDNYYDKDRTFQKTMEIRQRSDTLKMKPNVAFDPVLKLCTIRFPESVTPSSVSGTIRFFRVAEARSDFSQKLELNEGRFQTLSLSGRPKGVWIVKISFHIQELEYYFEERILLP